MTEIRLILSSFYRRVLLTVALVDSMSVEALGWALVELRKFLVVFKMVLKLERNKITLGEGRVLLLALI